MRGRRRARDQHHEHDVDDGDRGRYRRGATGAEGTTTSATETEGLPIEDLVALAAGVAPDEVACGDEAIEAVIGSGGTCSVDGKEYVVADFDEKAELDGMTVRLSDIETTRKVRGDYLRPKTSKEGSFVVGTLAVTNTADKGSQLFDDFGEQVRLHVDTATYVQPFAVLNGVLTDSFLWKGNKIKAGDTQVGKVVFDVPEIAVEQLGEEGSIEVLDFSEQGNFKRADEVGLLRTNG